MVMVTDLVAAAVLLLDLSNLVNEFASALCHLNLGFSLVIITITLLLNRHALADMFSCRSTQTITHIIATYNLYLHIRGVLIEHARGHPVVPENAARQHLALLKRVVLLLAARLVSLVSRYHFHVGSCIHGRGAEG